MSVRLFIIFLIAKKNLMHAENSYTLRTIKSIIRMAVLF